MGSIGFCLNLFSKYIYIYIYIYKNPLWLIYVENNNNNRIDVFRVKQVVFGISLSVKKVLFSLTEYIH